MRVNESLVRLMMHVADWHRAALERRDDDPERGDVPGWVLVTMMSAALVGVLYVVAAEELERVLRDALAIVLP